MPITFNNTRLREIAAILLLAIASASMAEGAERVRWEDLPKRIRKKSNRDFIVATKDGELHRGRCIGFTPTELEVADVNHSDRIAHKNVRQIVVGQKGRYSSQIVNGLDDDDLIAWRSSQSSAGFSCRCCSVILA